MFIIDVSVIDDWDLYYDTNERPPLYIVFEERILKHS